MKLKLRPFGSRREDSIIPAWPLFQRKRTYHKQVHLLLRSVFSIQLQPITQTSKEASLLNYFSFSSTGAAYWTPQRSKSEVCFYKMISCSSCFLQEHLLRKWNDAAESLQDSGLLILMHNCEFFTVKSCCYTNRNALKTCITKKVKGWIWSYFSLLILICDQLISIKDKSIWNYVSYLVFNTNNSFSTGS